MKSTVYKLELSDYTEEYIKKTIGPAIKKKLSDSLRQLIASAGSAPNTGIVFNVTPNTSAAIEKYDINLQEIASIFGNDIKQINVTLEDRGAEILPSKKILPGISYAWSWTIPSLKRTFFVKISEPEVLAILAQT